MVAAVLITDSRFLTTLLDCSKIEKRIRRTKNLCEVLSKTVLDDIVKQQNRRFYPNHIISETLYLVYLKYLFAILSEFFLFFDHDLPDPVHI